MPSCHPHSATLLASYLLAMLATQLWSCYHFIWPADSSLLEVPLCLLSCPMRTGCLTLLQPFDSREAYWAVAARHVFINAVIHLWWKSQFLKGHSIDFTHKDQFPAQAAKTDESSLVLEELCLVEKITLMTLSGLSGDYTFCQGGKGMSRDGHKMFFHTLLGLAVAQERWAGCPPIRRLVVQPPAPPACMSCELVNLACVVKHFAWWVG